MRHWLMMLSLLVLLAGCMDSGKYAAMRSSLDSINRLNRADQPFMVCDVLPLADYFAHYGSANDQMLACYLLGRAYHEEGEVPMALQYYQEAIDRADTVIEDCDFAQLSRVYGQMSNIYFVQGMHDLQNKAIDMCISSALQGKDTLAALLAYEQKIGVYAGKGNTDSVLIVCSNAYSQYKKYGYDAYAAGVLGRRLRADIKKGDTLQARQDMEEYEEESGFFHKGEIESGREVYYNLKACFYMQTGKLDSAEYYYRKELWLGADFNNQNAGAMGLAELFNKKHQPDSVSKYAMYAYAMNDSLYAKTAIEIVGRMQAIYDYSRHQRIAHAKAEEAQRERYKNHQLVLLLLLLICTCSIGILLVVKRYKTKRMKYLQSLTELKQLRFECQKLYQHEKEFQDLIRQKEKQIKDFERKVSRYGKQIYFTTGTAERCLNESITYQRIQKMAVKGELLSPDDKKQIVTLITEYFPGFDDFLATNSRYMKKNGLYICILLRMHFTPKSVGEMLGISKSKVSQVCREMMLNIFKKDGSTKKLQVQLCEIY